jgi:2Fe-2S iron-sulfur cluster protein
MTFVIKINGNIRSVDVDGDTPLLWVLRDVLGMTGTKFGCGMALCGACTIHIDGTATRSCVTPIDRRVNSIGHRRCNEGHRAIQPRAGRCRNLQRHWRRAQYHAVGLRGAELRGCSRVLFHHGCGPGCRETKPARPMPQADSLAVGGKGPTVHAVL